jgi:hypothetical protein
MACCKASAVERELSRRGITHQGASVLNQVAVRSANRARDDARRFGYDPEGEMRHPIFLGLLIDKKALDVIREQA